MTTTTTVTAPDKTAKRMATSIAGRFSKLARNVTNEDIQQEAYLAYYKHVAVVNATWDPERGVPLNGMLANRIYRHLGDYLYDMGSPVVYKHRRSELKNVSAVQHFDDQCAAGSPGADVLLDQTRWRLAVQTRVRELAGERGVAIAPVVFGEASVADVAAAHDMDAKVVRRMTKQVIEKLKDDPVLADLWGQL